MRPTVRVIARSVEGRPIRVHRFEGGAGDTVLILAAMHGDEPKTVYVARRFMEMLGSGDATGRRHTVLVVPEVNPDGFAARRRTNASRVDLNRNFPTADWLPGPKRSRYYGGPSPASEPETRALIKLILGARPRHIVTLHSISDHRECNNYNGRAARLARKLERYNGYPVNGDIGYATPGSFGTWAGVEQDIPTVTLELPSHTSRQRDWLDNREALLAAVRA